jgi:antitoxin VapB
MPLEATLETTRAVRLFRNGRNQAVRIPREFELPGQDALMSREGDALVIRAVRRRSLLEVLGTLDPLNEDFPEIDDPLPERARL